MKQDERGVEEILAEHRASIDRLDTILIFALGERFEHTKAVGKLKAEHGMPPSDPEREARQVERLQRLAISAGVDPEFAKTFINFIIKEVIRHHRQFQN
ncbi:MAG: chorismate mutase [Rhodobacteraceae bacterium]|nr:chorismate mutase [Paracoccaceae bacterium]